MHVGDTDSVLCQFAVPEEHRFDMHYHHQLAQRVAEEVTKTFKKPIELEFEKTYYPYLLFSKKRYCGGMYTSPDKMDYIDTKGIQMVRRGTVEAVREMCVDVLNKIMINKSSELAVAAAQQHVLEFVRGNIPLEKLVMSKSLRSGYKNASQPHVAVAEKLRQRRGGIPVPLGERVQYVFIKPNDPRSLQTERAEDPEYVKENGTPLDLLYYLDHQVLPPLTGLLELLTEDPVKAVMTPEIDDIVQKLRAELTQEIKVSKRVKTNAKNRQYEITRFFK